jgi:hypothetical protein
MRRDRWNTYAEYGYAYDVANDQRSAGGVHLHQVRKGPVGWQTRTEQSNGRHTSYGPVSPIDDQTGEAYYATALADKSFGGY